MLLTAAGATLVAGPCAGRPRLAGSTSRGSLPISGAQVAVIGASALASRACLALSA